MNIISQPKKIDSTLVKLMRKYDTYHIATAWASVGFNAYDELINNQDKIKKMVVGTHFYQTHPDFMYSFIDSKKVNFILNSSGIYHPKVYLFSNNKKEWECIIGSANFTQSALSKNSEVVVHIKNTDNNSKDIYKSIKEIIDDYWNDSKPITEENYHNYKNIWKKNQKFIKPLKEEYGRSRKKKTLIESAIFSQTWDEYYKEIQQDDFHSFEGRIKLLNKAKTYFEAHKAFNEMSINQRRKIAGTISKNQNTSDIGWGWFGSMIGAGKFKNRINENNEHISLALGAIPIQGRVTRQNYNAFVSEFNSAFPDGGSGLAIGSRLLAMKRPDYFVCLDDRNRTALCNEFGITRPSSFEAYWEDIIKRIQNSVWWGSEIPTEEEEKQAWLGRAAMLDAVFYEEE